MCQNNMTFHNDKPSNQKCLWRKKVYKLPKDVDSKRKFEIKAIFYFFFFGSPKFRQLCPKHFFCLQNIMTLRKNQPLAITMSQDKWGGKNKKDKNLLF